jgi:hypothetical protein
MPRLAASLWILIVTCLGHIPFACGQGAQQSSDTVIFNNGDSLNGTISSATSSAITFANDAVGPLQISWSYLRSVRVTHHATIFVGRSSASHYSFESANLGVVRSQSELALRITSPGIPQDTQLYDVTRIDLSPPPPSSATPAAPPTPAASPGWLIPKFVINTALIEATQHQQTYGAELDLLRNWNSEAAGWPHQRTEIQLIPNYSDTRKNSKIGSATVIQEYEGLAQHLVFFSSDNFYGTLVADAYRNNSLGLYFQQNYGAGLGIIVHDIELNADVRFIGQHFYAPYPSKALVGSEFSERYDISLDFLKSGASLSETGIIIPVFNASRAWQGRARIDLTIPLTKTIQFTTTAANYYVENTPDAYHKNYFKNTLGIQYTPATKK